jgi:hypothetical protein
LPLCCIAPPCCPPAPSSSLALLPPTKATAGHGWIFLSNTPPSPCFTHTALLDLRAALLDLLPGGEEKLEVAIPVLLPRHRNTG